MHMKCFTLILLFNLLMSIDFGISLDASRRSNGLLYPRKRFIPSENRFYIGLYRSRDRLRCIKLCQELSICQTVMYDKRQQECTLFSEHVEYGFGRLYEENNEHLVTVRLDKDSLKDLHDRMRETKDKMKQSSTLFSAYRKQDYDTCHNCDL